MTGELTRGGLDRLAAALERAGVDGANVETLLAAPRLLEAMAEHARGTLGDDVRSSEALRRLLGLGAGLALPIGADEEAAEVVSSCEGGLFDAGRLVATLLASARIGAGAGLAGAFVDITFGLARASIPAEMVLRAVDDGVGGDELRAVVRAVSATSMRAAILPSLLADPCVLRTWRMLVRYRRLVGSTATGPWDAATCTIVASVSPRTGCPSDAEPLSIVLAEGDLATEALDALKSGDLQAVFTSADGAVALVKVDGDRAAPTVKVPPSARPGWVGLTWPRLRTRARRHREEVRALWASESEEAELAATPVPIEWLQPIAEGGDTPAPLRTASAMLLVAGPSLRLDLQPAVLAVGETATLTWDARGAREVVLEPGGSQPPFGRMEIVAGADAAEISVAATVAGRCGTTTARATSRVRARVREVEPPAGAAVAAHEALTVTVRIEPPGAARAVRVTVGGHVAEAEISGDEATVVIESETLEGPLSGRVELLSGHEVDAVAEIGPWIAEVDRRPRVVVVRPAVLRPAFDRVSASVLSKMLSLRSTEPPWVDEAVLSLPYAPAGHDAPGTTALLAALDVFAARCPGFEDAIWVAVLPYGHTSFSRIVAGSAARAVAVATLDALGEVLAARPEPVGAVQQRLRIVGELRRDGAVSLEPLVEEERAAAKGGAGVDLGLDLVGIDGRGHERVVAPVNAVSGTLPARFAVLLPSDPELELVELRRRSASPADGSPVAARLVRSGGRPTLETRVDGRAISWQWRHDRGAQPKMWLEAGDPGGFCAYARVDVCRGGATLPAAPLATRWRLVATDGWNTVARELGEEARPDLGPVIRWLPGSRRVWADAEAVSPESVAWTAAGATGVGFVFDVPPGATEVVLRVDDADGPIEARRTLEEGA